MAQTYTFPTGDFVTSTLSGAITAAATSATIGTGLEIPASNGILFLDYDSSTAVGSDNGPETISYTSYTTGTGALSGITRGLGWTTGVAHANASKVASALSALHFTTAKQIDATMVDDGMVVQVVKTNSSAVATGTTTIPLDDTIPQKTEGDEYLTLAITPKSTTNVLVIDAVLHLSHSAAAAFLIAGLFQDTTADALATASELASTATGNTMLKLRHTMTASTTSATTFKIRAGSSSAGTTTFNGQAGARLFGAITKSSIVITEYKAS